jgi:hypothetical protein
MTALGDTRRPAARAAVLAVLIEQTTDYPGGHEPLTMSRDLLAYRTGLPRTVAAAAADALAKTGAVTRLRERGRVVYYVPRAGLDTVPIETGPVARAYIDAVTAEGDR